MATTSKKTKDKAARSATTGQKRVKVTAGQLVAVPLMDGTFALLHVASFDGDIVGAHFAHRATTPEQLLQGLEEVMEKRLITIAEVTPNEVKNGRWPVIGHREPLYPDTMLDMKGRSHTANFSECLLNAYYGFRPWDEMKDPLYYEKKLLPGVPVPPTVRYKRDFAEPVTEQPTSAAGGSASPSAGEGASAPGAELPDEPGEIHVEIKYQGDGLPSIELLHRRQAVERALEKAGAGEVTDAGGGGGVMDIYLQTDSVRRAAPQVKAALVAAGFKEGVAIDFECPVPEDEAG